MGLQRQKAPLLIALGCKLKKKLLLIKGKYVQLGLLRWIEFDFSSFLLHLISLFCSVVCCRDVSWLVFRFIFQSDVRHVLPLPFQEAYSFGYIMNFILSGLSITLFYGLPLWWLTSSSPWTWWTCILFDGAAFSPELGI